MKMIGMSVRSTTRFWTSSPVRSGRATSSIRQLGPSRRGCARKACAEANVSGCHPAWRINNSSDSRTDTSSSTTKTTGADGDIAADRAMAVDPIKRYSDLVEAMAPLISRWSSARADRSRNRIDQFRVAEWLEEALHRTVVEKAWADSLLRVRGNKNGRDFLAPTRELSLEIWSR